MPKLNKITIKINGDEYSIKPAVEIREDTVLVLPLRAFVGAEHFGATRNVVVTPAYFNEADISRVLDIR